MKTRLGSRCVVKMQLDNEEASHQSILWNSNGVKAEFSLQQRWCGGGRGEACSLVENRIQDVFGGHPCLALCAACLFIGIATIFPMLATSTCDAKKLTPWVAGGNEGSEDEKQCEEGYQNYHDVSVL